MEYSLKQKRIYYCPTHMNNELKLFCTICRQVICNDCTILLHRGHKCLSLAKASKIYLKMMKEALEKTKPLCDYTIHSIAKLNDVSKKVNSKCDIVHNDVENYLAEYFEALEVHRRTLLSQIARERENKMEIILAQKSDLGETLFRRLLSYCISSNKFFIQNGDQPKQGPPLFSQRNYSKSAVKSRNYLLWEFC